MADTPAPAAASSRFKFDGKEYAFERLRLKEARDIQRVTGFTIGEFEDQVSKGDMDCIAALIWILQKRDNPNLRFDDVDGDLDTFEIVEDEPAAEGEPDAEEGKDEAPPAASATTAGPSSEAESSPSS